MSPAASAASPHPSFGRDFVNIRLNCVTCGYSLLGLHRSSRCPECGTDVDFSRAGAWLCNAPPSWNAPTLLGAQLCFGWRWAAAIITAAALAMVDTPALLVLAFLAAWCIGIFLISRTRPGLAHGAAPLLARVLVLLFALAIGSAMLLPELPRGVSLALAASSYPLFCFASMAESLMLLRLSARASERGVLTTARANMVGWALHLGLAFLAVFLQLPGLLLLGLLTLVILTAWSASLCWSLASHLRWARGYLLGREAERQRQAMRLQETGSDDPESVFDVVDDTAQDEDASLDPKA
jgi:hypothetical protein